MNIETKRLILRELTQEDLPALFSVLGDKENMRFYPRPFDEVRVLEWIEKNRERYRIFGFGLWAVCLRETGELIGDCGLTMQNIHGEIKPEIGYHIRRDMQRKGYAGEAAAAVRDWTFANTPFRCVYAYMPRANVPSAATAHSIGMRLLQTYTNSENVITLVYGMEKE